MTKKPIELTEKDIVLVCTEMNGDYIGISTDDFDFEETKQKILQTIQEYPKLKEEIRKIIIDEKGYYSTSGIVERLAKLIGVNLNEI